MGQYGGVIGGVVGAVVGFFAGGNVYAGWMIGSAIGGAYSASREVIQGPKVGDIQTQTAQEGGPRPIVFGRSHPIAGNIIADGGPRKVTRRESQGKGGPKVETESVYRTYAVGFCEGEAELLQAWRNNTLVYDAQDPLMAAENSAFLRYARWYNGSFTQMPSPDLESVLGSGNVHGHRGTAYLVLANEDTTDQRGMWSQWKVRVSTTAMVGTPNDLHLRDTADFAGNALQVGAIMTLSPGGVPSAITGYEGNNQEIVEPGEYFEIRDYSSGLLAHTTRRIYNYDNEQNSVLGRMAPIGFNGVETVLGQNPSTGTVAIMVSGNVVSRLLPFVGASPSWHFAPTPQEYAGLCWFAGNSVYLGNRASGPSPGQPWEYKIYRWPIVSAEGDFITASAEAAVPMAPGTTYFFMHISRSSKVRVINEVLDQYRYSDGLAQEGQELVPDDLLMQAPIQMHGFGVDEFLDLAIYCYSKTGTGHVLHAFRRSTGEEISSYQLSPDPSQVPSTRIIFSDAGVYIQRRSDFYYLNILTSDGSLVLGELVSRISELSGLTRDKADTSALTDSVRGFTITNTYPAYGALQALSSVFLFNPCNADGRVRFVPSGGNVVAHITDADMIDDDTDIESDSRRGDSMGVPRVLHLNYYDIAGGLNTDKQHSERPDGTRAEGEMSMQTPVILSADEAATVVSKQHAMMAEAQKGELHVPLPDSWLRLTDTDPVIVSYNGKSVRGVITESIVMDGEQRYKLIRDRQSIYTMQVEGIPAAPVTRPPSSIVGPTVLHVLDIPQLRDSDDMLGLYLAISGIMPAWQGAFVELSMDGGETYLDGQTVRAESIVGELTTALGDHPQEYPDTVNACEVSILTPDALLEQTTLAGMLNRRNLALIGDEIVNFAEADEVSPGVWELSHWLRGRKGTQTSAHAPGTRFILLSGVIFVAADLTMLGRTLTVRATSLGADSESATVTSITFTGQSQTERAPAYLQARRDGSDVVATWQGVGRLGGGVHVAMGAHFRGYRVTLTDGASTQTNDTTAPAFTGPLSAFTGPVTVRVQQRNEFTGLGPSIEVTI